MADETEEAKKTQLEYLEKQRATYQKGTKEYELLTGIIQKLNKSIKETQTQINETLGAKQNLNKDHHAYQN